MQPTITTVFSILALLCPTLVMGCGGDSPEDTGTTPAGTAGTSGGSSGAGGIGQGGARAGGASGAAGHGASAGTGGAGAGGQSGVGGHAGSATAGAGGTSIGGAGGTGGSGGQAATTIAGACTDFWTKICGQWETCFPSDLASSFADVPSCISASAARCSDTNGGPSSSATGDEVTACFDGYGTLACGDLFRFLHENAPKPAACTLPAGKLADGAGCFAASECASQFCVVDRTGCGVCGKQSAAGAACKAESDCPGGMGCRSQKCVAYGEKGDSCAVNRCHADLACVNDVCTTALADGALCDPQNDSCGIESACNALTNHCTPLVAAKPGDPCGYLPSGDTAACGQDTRCQVDGAIGTGTCVAAAKPGEACVFRAQCTDFSTCQKGFCFVPSATTCEGGSGGAGGAGGGGGAGGTGGIGGSGGNGGVDHGAPSDVYPAPHPAPPHATKGAAPAMSSPVIVPVFFAGDGGIANLTTFITKAVASSYFTTTIGEYVTGAPMAAPAVTVTDKMPATITDADIQTFLRGKLDGTHPEYGTPDINHVYTLFFPKAIKVDDPREGVACTDFGGYHGTVVLADGTATAYAVVPRCDMMGLFQTTESASHELVEAMTDPRVYFPAWAGVDDDHVAWSSLGGGELGDLCEFDSTNFYMDTDIGFRVQSTWSNASALAGHSPCVPWTGVYFGAAPVLEDDVFVGGFLSQKTKGIRIPAGGSAVVELDLFSDGPTSGPMTIAVKDGATLTNGPAQLSFTLDKTTGFNGEKAYVTIKVTGAGKTNGEVFVVETTVGGRSTQWFGLVVQ